MKCHQNLTYLTINPNLVWWSCGNKKKNKFQDTSYATGERGRMSSECMLSEPRWKQIYGEWSKFVWVQHSRGVTLGQLDLFLWCWRPFASYPKGLFRNMTDMIFAHIWIASCCSCLTLYTDFYSPISKRFQKLPWIQNLHIKRAIQRTSYQNITNRHIQGDDSCRGHWLSGVMGGRGGCTFMSQRLKLTPKPEGTTCLSLFVSLWLTGCGSATKTHLLKKRKKNTNIHSQLPNGDSPLMSSRTHWGDGGWGTNEWRVLDSRRKRGNKHLRST